MKPDTETLILEQLSNIAALLAEQNNLLRQILLVPLPTQTHEISPAKEYLIEKAAVSDLAEARARIAMKRAKKAEKRAAESHK